MSERILNEVLCLKQDITENDYQELKKLETICTTKDRVSLKLELHYKLNLRKRSEIGINKVNEFFYYIDGSLVSYLGISSYGANIAEINGMTHPNFRRKGLFLKLFQLAMDECKRRGFEKVLLLTDEASASGIAFINSTSAEYDFSEYRMKALYHTPSNGANSIALRKANQLNAKEISRQNIIYFNDPEVTEDSYSIDEHILNSTYMVELQEETIGKICIEYTDSTAYIFGFGILPEFRGKGYGRETLTAAMNLCHQYNFNMIELDVACKNRNALNLYTSCGFEVQSVMNYYVTI
jgi:ribosomal protein S18 acetylase RimI-like enzyme